MKEIELRLKIFEALIAKGSWEADGKALTPGDLARAAIGISKILKSKVSQ